jgi:hypothetical protein
MTEAYVKDLIEAYRATGHRAPLKLYVKLWSYKPLLLLGATLLVILGFAVFGIVFGIMVEFIRHALNDPCRAYGY